MKTRLDDPSVGSQKFFISSTMTEPNLALRQAVCDALKKAGHTPVGFRLPNFSSGSNRKDLLSVCLDNIADCDVVILIAGPDFGHPSPRDDTVSVTWEEFRHARRHNKLVLRFVPKPLKAIYNTWKDAKRPSGYHFEPPASLRLMLFLDELLDEEADPSPYHPFSDQAHLLRILDGIDFDCWYAREVASMLQTNLIGASELTGWADFLPCSLETRTFMEGHHLSLRKRRPACWHDKPRFVEEYDTIGNQRRAALESAPRDTRPILNHVMLKTDLFDIASRTAPNYAECKKEDRRECLLNLKALIGDEKNRINLFLCDDESDVAVCHSLFKYCDSFAGIRYAGSDRISWFYRIPGRRTYWGNDPSEVRAHLDWLEKIRSRDLESERQNSLVSIGEAVGILSSW
jgi:hypothetical protein